eukprot:2672574-Prymnesium_polylepis.1
MWSSHDVWSRGRSRGPTARMQLGLRSAGECWQAYLASYSRCDRAHMTPAMRSAFDSVVRAALRAGTSRAGVDVAHMGRARRCCEFAARVALVRHVLSLENRIRWRAISAVSASMACAVRPPPRGRGGGRDTPFFYTEQFSPPPVYRPPIF